jgi:hypothetical protein
MAKPTQLMARYPKALRSTRSSDNWATDELVEHWTFGLQVECDRKRFFLLRGVKTRDSTTG